MKIRNICLLALLAIGNFTLAQEKECVHNGHAYVNLGLPSGNLWATCNVGAVNPEEYGDYFAWGEIAPKSDYLPNTYKWQASEGKTEQEGLDGANCEFGKYQSKKDAADNGFSDNVVTLDVTDDAAASNWGGLWRMPTKEDFEELKANCKWKWISKKSVNGYLVKGENGNCIFLPAAGYRWGSLSSLVGSHSAYWSSSLVLNSSKFAFVLDFYWDDVVIDEECDLYGGFSVRPICSGVE